MKELMKKYARLLVEVGVNIQKGQELVIRCPVERADFARLCVEAAYAAGCSEVTVFWQDDFVARQRFLHADASVFENIPRWQYHFLTDHAVDGAAVLSLSGANPENLVGVEPSRLRAAERAQATQLTEYRRLQMTDSFQWCIGGVATEGWAKKVFPNAANPVSELWQAIFKTALVREGEDPVQLWRNKQADFERRTAYLNQKHYKALHYRNSLGTDLVIGLPDGHIWQGGSSKAKREGNTVFLPNIPTEEIFTAPSRSDINGVVYASMPLVKNGSVAENFSFTIKDGRITDVKAEKGLDMLLSALDADENARRFGEVALVPCDSAIFKLGTLFYNTLYDENASCHLAFGAAYPDTIEGGSEMSPEEFEKAGGNNSGIHVDFMIGTTDLSIDGIDASGNPEPVFINGNFAF